MNTLFINGRFLTQTVTGVQRYCIELVRQLDLLLTDSAIASRIKVACFIPPGPFAQPGWENIKLLQVGLNKGNLWEQVDLAFYLRGNLLFSPANIGPWHYRNQIVMFHDASIFAMPQAYSPVFRTKYIFIFHQLTWRARLILTNSAFSQAELARYLKAPPERFKVIPLGADHLDRVPADRSILQRNRLEKESYFLLVASLSPNKNIQRLLEAIKLIKSDLKILIVGNPRNPNVFRETNSASLPANVQRLGFLEDQELRALYENALGLIFPSTYEGFGLPILEAMRCGCPVLCSNTTSLPGTAGDAALFFDPFDVQGIAKTIYSFLEKPVLQEELRQKGYRQASKYTWALTAQKTLEVFLDALHA